MASSQSIRSYNFFDVFYMFLMKHRDNREWVLGSKTF